MMWRKWTALLMACTMMALCAGALAEGVEPVLPEGAKLTYWCPNPNNPMAATAADMVYFQELQTRTGVELDVITGANKDALALMIVADETPDIIHQWWNDFPGGIDRCLADGIIMPLNELMEAGHMPNFVAYLEAHPEVDRLCKNDDGQYYSLPFIRGEGSYLIFNGNIVRKDWLDELGLEVPETIEEMEQVLLAFKEQKGATVGYTVAWKDYSRMVYAFGIAQDFYINEEGKVAYGYIEPEYKDFLTLFRRWIDLGIADPDMFTHDYDTFSAKIATGQTGLIWGNTGGELGSLLESIKPSVPGMDWIPVPNPVQNAGDVFPMNISASQVNSIGASISASCEYPEAAAKLLDYVYSPEGTILSNFGLEGESFEYDADGNVVFTELVTNNPNGYTQEQVVAYFSGEKNKSFINTKEAMDLAYKLDIQRESVEMWRTDGAPNSLMPNATLTADETETYVSIMSEINTYVEEMRLKFMLGSEPLENYEKFVQTLYAMGIDEALAIKQAAYERFLTR